MSQMIEARQEYLAEVAVEGKSGPVFLMTGAGFIPSDTTRIKVWDSVLILGGRLRGNEVEPDEGKKGIEIDISHDWIRSTPVTGLLTHDGRVYYDPEVSGKKSPGELTEHIKRLHPDMVRAVLSSR